eukprot:TRINITY_DN19985_c0_g1_i2.p2 TRINITY_DN19985_c0_g1~~TRINITY_DN19985_c0_g1_i2.p2  ORF type:complete len:286 (-),score=53.58 TRINITY_DN19985_c0_g1_i2:976-1833(-)
MTEDSTTAECSPWAIPSESTPEERSSGVKQPSESTAGRRSSGLKQPSEWRSPVLSSTPKGLVKLIGPDFVGWLQRLMEKSSDALLRVRKSNPLCTEINLGATDNTGVFFSIEEAFERGSVQDLIGAAERLLEASDPTAFARGALTLAMSPNRMHSVKFVHTVLSHELTQLRVCFVTMLEQCWDCVAKEPTPLENRHRAQLIFEAAVGKSVSFLDELQALEEDIWSTDQLKRERTRSLVLRRCNGCASGLDVKAEAVTSPAGPRLHGWMHRTRRERFDVQTRIFVS